MMGGGGDNGYCGGTVARVGGVEEASTQGERERRRCRERGEEEIGRSNRSSIA
jgi:hypothetical protein